MSKQISKRAAQRRKNQQKTPVWLFIAGFGLLIVALLIIPSNQSNATAQQQELSSIPMEVNYPAPELSLENVSGGTQSLADFRTNIVLVNNWATWCPPCKAELPTLVAYYNDHVDEGLVIIGIEAGEPAKEVSQFVADYSIPYPVWLDPNNLAGRAFKNPNLPNSYVIDRTGTIRLTWTGMITRELLEQYVTPLLAAE